jgi:hypothetical protein
MPTPYQSKLIPYEGEILALRGKRPPTPYARIAQILREKYALSVHRDTIHSFVRVRSRGRKVACFAHPADVCSQQVKKKSPAAQKVADCRPSQPPAATEAGPKRKFNYTPSDHYNLTRLTPEQIAALHQRHEKGD